MWSERSGEERSGGEEEEEKGVGVKEWVQLEVRKGGGEREEGRGWGAAGRILWLCIFTRALTHELPFQSTRRWIFLQLRLSLGGGGGGGAWWRASLINCSFSFLPLPVPFQKRAGLHGSAVNEARKCQGAWSREADTECL